MLRANLLKFLSKKPEVARKVLGAYLTDMQKLWRRIRRRAALEGVRIHDLRHSFASYAVSQGLPMMGKLLGHTQVQTTALYAHLMSDPIKVAAGQVSWCITGLVSS